MFAAAKYIPNALPGCVESVTLPPFLPWLRTFRTFRALIDLMMGRILCLDQAPDFSLDRPDFCVIRDGTRGQKSNENNIHVDAIECIPRSKRTLKNHE